MKLHQLSLFVENRPGQLAAPCRALAEAGINILTLSLADTEQFGILRLIVRDWQRAKTILEAADCVVNVTEVLAVEVRHQPGGMLEILEFFEREDLNIEYTYAFTAPRGDKAVLVFRFDDPERAVDKLKNSRINVVGGLELFRDVD